MIRSDDKLRKTAKIIESFKGCGKQTSQLLSVLLSEIGKINSKEIASLCGLAAINNDSGNYKERRIILGGRKNVRNALYMVAISSIRSNDVIKKQI